MGTTEMVNIRMGGEIVNDVDQAFEMACNNHVHLIFANTLIKEESYDNAAQQLIEAAYSEIEIAERWDEERKEERELIKDILCNENAVWISKAMFESTENIKKTDPRLFIKMNFDDVLESHRRERVVSKLEETLGLEEIHVVSGAIPVDAVWGACYDTRFENVIFSTFFMRHPETVADASRNEFEEGWYYNFSA